MMVDSRLLWLVFLSVFGLVLYALFRPAPPEMIFEHSDKAGHVLAFFALSLTARLVLFKVPRLFFWLALFALAFLLEYLQGEIRPLRVYSIHDAYANLLGVAVSLCVVKFFKLSKKLGQFAIN